MRHKVRENGMCRGEKAGIIGRLEHEQKKQANGEYIIIILNRKTDRR